MAITIIKNQPIRFLNADTPSSDCDCLGQSFCQLVNKNDSTQFQVNSSNQAINGTFDNNLDNWNVFEKIAVSVIITNESVEEECDGEIEVTATGGTGPYTYSINGGTFSGINTFTGLCAGVHVITVKDSNGNEGSVSVEIVTNIVCGSYKDTDDLIPFQTSQLLNCLTSDFI